MSARTITIIVQETASRRGLYDAHLENGGRQIVSSSVTPFIDAAKRLLELGYNASTVLLMRRPGREQIDLKGPIGVAAKLEPATRGFRVRKPDHNRVG